MRKFLTFTFLLCVAEIFGHAQGRYVAGQMNTELGVNYYSVEEDNNFYDMYGPSLSIAGGVRFCHYIFLGISSGVNVMIDQGKDKSGGEKIINDSWYRKYMFPIDVNMRGYIPLSHLTPFYLHMDVAAGPLCNYEKYYYVDGFSFKGFHVRTGIGLSYKKFSFTMGWETLRRQNSVFFRAGVTIGKYTK